MFRPNWPYSGVWVVMVKDSAALCSAVFFPPASVYSNEGLQRTVNDAAHRRHKSSKFRSIQCNRMIINVMFVDQTVYSQCQITFCKYLEKGQCGND
jgi:hypothetical protein